MDQDLILSVSQAVIDALPHPAMIINSERTVLAANKIALEIGAVVGDHCWKEFAKSTFLSCEHLRLSKENPDAPEIRCTFCLANEALQNQSKENDPNVLSFDRQLDTYWVAINKNIYLHYAVDITDHVRTTHALKESEERLSVALEANRDGLWDWDIKNNKTSFNEIFYTMLGCAPNEFLQSFKDFIELIHEEDRAAVKQAVNDHLSGETAKYSVEFRFPRKDGDFSWILSRGKIVDYDESGKPLRFIGTNTDITERKQNEQKLKASEEKYRRLFETMAQGVLYQASDGVILSANPAAEKILGLTFEQMQGKTSMDPRWQMIEEDGTQVSGEAHPTMVALRTGQIVGPTIKGVFHPDENRHVWLNITAIPLFQPGENSPYQVYATFEDITKRKEAQDALQESLNRIEAIYASLDDAIVLVDPETRQIIECNSATARMFGYPSEEILGQDTRFMYVDQEDFERFGHEAIAAITDHGHYLTEFEMRRKDETVFSTENYVRPVRDSHGHIVYVVRVVRDITERKQAQLELQQKNQELGQFVHSVSHDLKSPLVTVRTYVELLRQDLLSTDQSQINEDLNYISNAADKMQQLLDVLLNYSRIGRKNTQARTLAVSQEVEDCLSTVAGILQQKQVQVVINEMPYQLHGDPLHFGQLWQNLIENAVKYMGDQTHPQIEIGGTQQAAQDVVFYVRDNGMGIPPEHSERIFNLFSQLNPGSDGSGLGLALVKKIVSIYQGRIWVESAGEGQGSCFMFTLPEALIK
ncbi:MAG: PAS domain S-box protein [Pelovirga sp.]